MDLFFTVAAVVEGISHSDTEGGGFQSCSLLFSDKLWQKGDVEDTVKHYASGLEGVLLKNPFSLAEIKSRNMEIRTVVCS